MQWSELQRDPKSVAALADAGDVRVRRRDGADLLLTREDRAAASGEGAIATVRMLRNLIAHVPVETAAVALSDEFPWLSLLPADAVNQFVAEFVKARGSPLSWGSGRCWLSFCGAGRRLPQSTPTRIFFAS